jgi:short-subunit dehydrogenase
MAYAVVTGASGGIGLEFARLLAKDKYDLLLVARNTEKLKAASDDIEIKFGVKVHYYPCDLSDLSSAKQVYSIVDKNNFNVEVLINNAGYGLNGSVDKLSIDEQENMIRLNCINLFSLTKLLLPFMLKNKKGRILNVASTAAFAAGPFMSVYYASKAFVLSFSEALSYEVKGTGVSVTCLAPGPTTTGFQERAKISNSRMFNAQSVMSAEKAAHIGYNALKKGKAIIVPGFNNKIMIFSSRFMPRSMNTAITGWLNKNR